MRGLPLPEQKKMKSGMEEGRGEEEGGKEGEKTEVEI